MNTARRKSKQRERIYSIIKENASHPTALWVYDTIRKEIPSVSMGNVYRNIRILIEEGRIHGMDFGDGIEHYEAVTGLHYHFICEKCKGISDFKMLFKSDIEKLAQENTANLIKSHTIQFFGLCEKCSKKAKIKN